MGVHKLKRNSENASIENTSLEPKPVTSKSIPPVNRMKFSEYQAQSVAKAIDQKDEINKLKNEVQRLRSLLKHQEETFEIEIDLLEKKHSKDLKKLEDGFQNELEQKSNEIHRLKIKYNDVDIEHKQYVSLLEQKHADEMQKLQKDSKNSEKKSEYLLVDSFRKIERQLKSFRRRKKEILRGTVPFCPTKVEGSKHETYVTGREDDEFGRMDDDLKRQVFLEVLQNQNYIIRYVADMLTKLDKNVDEIL